MKAKRRQELKTNDLAAWLDEVRRSASKWGGYLFAGIAAVAAVLIINAYMKSARAEARTSAYSDLRRAASMQTAGNLEKTDEEIRASLARIDELVDGSSDTAFKINALLDKAAMAVQLADQALVEPLDPGATEAQRRSRVEQFLADARAAYERITTEFASHALYCGRARFGLFEVEATAFVLDGDAGHRTRAEEQLKKILDNAALNATPLQTVAIDLLNDLDQVFTPVQFPSRPAPTPVPTPVPLGPVPPSDWVAPESTSTDAEADESADDATEGDTAEGEAAEGDAAEDAAAVDEDPGGEPAPAPNDEDVSPE